MKKLLVLSLVFSCITILTGQQDKLEELKNLKICPTSILVENGYEDLCGSLINAEYNFTGKPMKLISQNVRIENSFYPNYSAFECKCNYAVFPEDVEVTDCDGGKDSLTAPIYFFDALIYRWIEPPLNTEGSCERFKYDLAFSKNPTYYKSDFNSTYIRIPQTFSGITDDEKAVIMALPYGGSKWFSHEYLVENLKSSMNLLIDRAVSYSTCKPPYSPDISLFDLNPAYYSEYYKNSNEAKSVATPQELDGKITRIVNGTTSDGISELLFVIESTEDAEISIDEPVNSNSGEISFPWGKTSFNFSGNYFHVGIYKPPKSFPKEATEEKTDEGLIYTNIEIDLNVKFSDTAEEKVVLTIPLIRPPVVLVHGTFDTPENCWKTPNTGGIPMTEKLEKAGYKVFTVDYSATNGLGRLGEVPCGGNFLGSPVRSESSCFENNKQVVYKNPGGIEEAIRYYRQDLNLACSQADVIGHSLGGVLARVYASELYEINPFNPSRFDYRYKRPDNFMEGDINRLVTISSTHHGSDMAWYLYLLNEESYQDTMSFFADTLEINTLDALDNTSLISQAKLGLIWLLEGIRPDAGAIVDQIPGSPALRKIGNTPVPAHSIISVVEGLENLQDHPSDPSNSYYYSSLFTSMVFYLSQNFFDYVLHQIAEEWHRLPEHLKKNSSKLYKGIDRKYLEMYKDDREAFKNLYRDPLLRQWQGFMKLNGEIADKTAKYLPADMALADVGMGDFDDDFLDYFSGGNVEFLNRIVQTTFKLKELVNFKDFVNRIRHLIFRNDLNDCTVRFDSQLGFDNILANPDNRYYRSFDNVLHSFAPRETAIQDHVLNILGSGMDYFNEDGFPPAGRKLPVWLPEPGESPEDITGCQAICWSGYVPDHAREFAQIANEENVVILARPVNPDATALIADNRATKGMPVKGKSANWGPHKGMIPFDQRYSKIWKIFTGQNRDEQIEKFNKKVRDLLQKSPQIASKTHLNDLSFDCEEEKTTYEVFAVRTNLRTEAEMELRLLKKETGEIYTYDPNGPETCPVKECMDYCTLEELDTFCVLANPDPELQKKNGGEPPIYTADYDLLAIGFFDRNLFQNPKSTYSTPDFDPEDWDCDRGLINPEQSGLNDLLNKAVRENAKYSGGNVVHHGPENHFIKITLPNFTCEGESKKIEIPGSPYIDYPVTAFEPHPDRQFGSTGIVRSIPMGPPGFRDIHLKEYFHKMRIRGYNLYANSTAPGWQWEYYRPYSYENGFDKRDAPGLPDGIAEIPFPEKCNCDPIQLPPGPNKDNFTSKSRPHHKNYLLFPNPNPGREVSIRFRTDKPSSIKFRLVDSYGRTLGQHRIRVPEGLHQENWNLPHLPPGIYYLRIDDGMPRTRKLIIE